MRQKMAVILRAIAAICSLSAAILIVCALRNTAWRMKSYETGYGPQTVDHYSEEGLWKVCIDRSYPLVPDCKHLSTEITGKTKCHMLFYGIVHVCLTIYFFQNLDSNYLNSTNWTVTHV